MDEPQKDQLPPPGTPLGLYDRPARRAVTGIEVLAIIATVLWVVLALVFFLTAGREAPTGFNGPRFLTNLLTIFLPVGMIWVAATAARSNRVIREESQRLQAAIDGIRQAYVSQAQGGVATEPSVARKLDDIAASTRKAEAALTTFSTARRTINPTAPPPLPAAEAQTKLALGTPADDLHPPLATEDFIRALHFPETAEDEIGFAALRRALKDHATGQLVQASQDVLTLLSQDGIYMDDLRPDLARPEIWRMFAHGTRGRAVSPLGGIHDRASLALAAGRMKQDTIFRDAAHHFLRLFDRRFVAFEKTATDAEIQALSETRTARAFMLLGRAAGTFH